MSDEAKKLGITINTSQLGDELGYPVSLISAKYGQGYTDAYHLIEKTLQNSPVSPALSLEQDFAVDQQLEDKLEPAVTVVRLDLYRAETLGEELIKLGYLLDEKENAREYLEWHDKYADEIEDRVSGIDDKPRVFLDWGTKHAGGAERGTVAKGSASHKRCEKAGGINIAADFPMPYLTVGLEWILDQNPEIIIGCSEGYNQHGGGYETDDESELKEYFDEIIGLPGFENKKVYIITHEVTSGPGYLVGLAYHAKWFHPELFSDLDPQEIHQEYIDKFCDIDFDVREHGVFVYDP